MGSDSRKALYSYYLNSSEDFRIEESILGRNKYFLDDDEAKTALETTFGTVAEKFADQKDPTDFLGWVTRIAHLTCADQAAKVGGLADAEVKDLDLLSLADYKKEKKDGVLTFATVKDLTA